jgi:hypothetical protein
VVSSPLWILFGNQMPSVSKRKRQALALRRHAILCVVPSLAHEAQAADRYGVAGMADTRVRIMDYAADGDPGSSNRGWKPQSAMQRSSGLEREIERDDDREFWPWGKRIRHSLDDGDSVRHWSMEHMAPTFAYGEDYGREYWHKALYAVMARGHYLYNTGPIMGVISDFQRIWNFLDDGMRCYVYCSCRAFYASRYKDVFEIRCAWYVIQDYKGAIIEDMALDQDVSRHMGVGFNHAPYYEKLGIRDCVCFNCVTWREEEYAPRQWADRSSSDSEGSDGLDNL